MPYHTIEERQGKPRKSIMQRINDGMHWLPVSSEGISDVMNQPHRSPGRYRVQIASLTICACSVLQGQHTECVNDVDLYSADLATNGWIGIRWIWVERMLLADWLLRALWVRSMKVVNELIALYIRVQKYPDIPRFHNTSKKLTLSLTTIYSIKMRSFSTDISGNRRLKAELSSEACVSILSGLDSQRSPT
jgi:hypothetical protein